VPPQIRLTLPVALVLGAVHVFGGRLRFLHDVPRSAWPSAAGGGSVAYVFIHLLPEPHESQRAFDERLRNGFTGSLERHSYLIALFGLGLFYGLEQLAKSSKRSAKAAAEPTTSPGVFWIHLAAFAVYNALIGYLLLHRGEKDLRGLAIYAFAMVLPFIVNDHGLSADHGATYGRYERWILAAAVFLGWALGAATDVPRLLVSTLFAFLADGVVLNVLKEEPPEERQSRFSPFAAGYAALLLAT
jgi:hypothetical protein